MTPADIGDTIEKKMEGLVERVIQEEDEKRAKDVVSCHLAHSLRKPGSLRVHRGQSPPPEDQPALILTMFLVAHSGL